MSRHKTLLGRSAIGAPILVQSQTRSGQRESRGEQYPHIKCLPGQQWDEATYSCIDMFGVVGGRRGKRKSKRLLRNKYIQKELKEASKGTKVDSFIPTDINSRNTQYGFVITKDYNADQINLIDSDNSIYHTWAFSDTTDNVMGGYNSNVFPNLDLLLEQGESIQLYNEESNLIWEIDLNNFFLNERPDYDLHRHHDAWPLENGNILIHGDHYIDDVTYLGRNPNFGTSNFASGFIMEIQPIGFNEAEIVWEWYMVDHFVQDFDPSKLNYVSDITDHPDKIDINLTGEGGGYHAYDFSHFNTLHYNPELDQVVISSRTIGDGEFYVIQKPTGNIVFRCCNPQNYGWSGEQLTRHQHGVNWIPPGYPYEGNLILFNNGHTHEECWNLLEDNCDECLNCMWMSDFCMPFGPGGTICEQSAVLIIEQTGNWQYNYEVMHEIDGNSFIMGAGGGAFMLPNGNVLITTYNGYVEVSDPFTNPSTVWTTNDIPGSTEFRGVKYIPGCTDPLASNYNPAASYMYMINDGTCVIDSEEYITDIDGNIYSTVNIGDQLWMAENLKVTHYNDGTEIPTWYSNNEWPNLSTGAYAVYDDNESNANTYGYLYNWYAVETGNLCPEGWHVATSAEYITLSNYLGDGDGSKLAGMADLWSNGPLNSHPDFGTSGFTALPGGYRNQNNGNYSGMGITVGHTGHFWSSTEVEWPTEPSPSAWYQQLSYLWSDAFLHYVEKEAGFSVRCIRSLEPSLPHKQLPR